MPFMNKTTSLELLKKMMLSRMADKREAILYRQGKASFQVASSGHEALMVIPFLMDTNDYFFPYYRDVHLLLAKGLELKTLAKNFFAKSNSKSKGRNMHVHCGSAEHKIFPSAAPTASQCLPAVGVAWGQKLDKTKHITICTIGEGATRSGEFYEAVCYAVQENLPIVFIVEDNHYSISTPTEKINPFRLNIFDSRHFSLVDGSNVFSLFDAVKQAIEKARQGKGPSIIWCDLDRLESHTCSDNHKIYRSLEDINNLRDPITLYMNTLMNNGSLTPEEVESVWQETEEYVKKIYYEASLEPDPDPNEIMLHLYGEKIKHKEYNFTPLENINMVEATNIALEMGLTTDNKLLIFGEDVEDPKGGVFGFTKGLSTKYPARVINSPIAEATIIGTAVGLAAYGYKPVFEIQFIDFLIPGFNQLVTNVANLRWHSGSEWKCPLVLYASYGAYLPSGGLWHSQSNEGWWTHIPGLRVAVPSTPTDIIGLFLAAFQDDDPSLILIPKHIFRIKSKVIGTDIIPFGKAQLVKAGNDVTIIGWGNSIELIKEASLELERDSISVEIIDLRTLVPCDWETIILSLKKTGRIVVVQEDTKTSSFGSSIISEILTNEECFSYLYCSPKLISRDDIPIPYHQSLEYAVLPKISDIINAVKDLLN